MGGWCGSSHLDKEKTARATGQIGSRNLHPPPKYPDSPGTGEVWGVDKSLLMGGTSAAGHWYGARRYPVRCHHPTRSCALPVDRSAVADAYHQDDQLFVLEIGNHAVVSHSVLPKGLQWTGERFSELSRIVQRRDALAKEPQDADLNLSVEPGKVARCARIKPNRPGQGARSRPR